MPKNHRQTFSRRFYSIRFQAEEAQLLPHSQRYWLCEAVLLGDDCPWLYGRTVIPEETLSGPERKLINLGDVPWDVTCLVETI